MPETLSRRFVIAVLLAVPALPLAAQVRWRNMSVETVAGKQVRFVNGGLANYHRDGRLSGHLPDGSPFSGRWEIGPTNLFAGHPQSILITLDTGDTFNAYYLQEGDALYLVRRKIREKKGEIRARVKSIGAI